MDEIISQSPTPQETVTIMDFPQAILQIIKGKKITKLEWNNPQIYCILKDTFLMIHTIDNQFHTWTINEGDLIGNDYITIE